MLSSYCGMKLNKDGYYGCSVCGSIDRVLRATKGVKSLKENQKLQEQHKEFVNIAGI